MRTVVRGRASWRGVLLALLVAMALGAGCAPASGSPPAPAKPSGAATAPPAASGGGAAVAAPASGTAASGPDSSAATGSAVAAAPAASAAPGQAAMPSPLSPPQTITYGTSASVNSAGVYIGIERGYFRELGLDVEIVPFNGAADMFQPLAASQLDMGSADTGAGIFNALARGLPLRFVADSNHVESGHSPTAWMIRKDVMDTGAFHDLPDFRGKRLSGSARGSSIDSYVQRTLALAGLTPADVDLQYVSFPDVMPAFANQALDAAILIEPFATAAVEQGLAVRWKTTADLFGPSHATFIVFAPSFATQRQEAGRRFLIAYLRGVRDYRDAFDEGKDQDAVIAILTKYTNIKDPAVFKKIVVPAIDPNGEMIVQTVKEQQQWYVDHGFVPTPVDVDEYFDPSYAEYAVSVIGRR
ncbi:MAG TPA: ABC transporter substrate-binding protein [Chloroflexota bacterium]|nr:ABC transporter substrate-binding protein [Chloroflexota bacterium]